MWRPIPWFSSYFRRSLEPHFWDVNGDIFQVLKNIYIYLLKWIIPLDIFLIVDYYHNTRTANRSRRTGRCFLCLFICSLRKLSGASTHPAFRADSRFVGTSHRLLKGTFEIRQFFHSDESTSLGNLPVNIDVENKWGNPRSTIGGFSKLSIRHYRSVFLGHVSIF